MYRSEVLNCNLFSSRDFFARDGSCTIINNWNETVMTDGQKVVRYTVVLKFDDQMVANSVKQKLVQFDVTLSAIMSQCKNDDKSGGTLYREPLEIMTFQDVPMQKEGENSGETY